MESTRFRNTSLPVIILGKKKIRSLEEEYSTIGYGSESIVYKYNEKTIVKVFKHFGDKRILMQKFAKIEELAKLHDESFTFPKGLVGYEDGQIEGYYTNYVSLNPDYMDFDELSTEITYLKDMRKVFQYIIKADAAIQRAHNRGIIIGDIKGDNIMIDENDNPIFVDTDNYAYKEYGFDLVPSRSLWLNNIFGGNASPIDNDIFVFSMMAIQILVSNLDYLHMYTNRDYFKKLVEHLNVSRELKDGLELIFSDAQNKPYIGPIVKELNPEVPILTSKSIKKLNGI